MAERRMVSKAVLHSPSFLAMPVAAQMLYVHLELFADDDGIVASPLQVADDSTVGSASFGIGFSTIKYRPADTTQRSMKPKKLVCGQRAGPTVCVNMMQT